MNVIQLLHGSNCVIETPDITIGNPHNDYGMGFYCTRSADMAGEWACQNNTDGFVNVYDFDMAGLNVLNLLDGKHTVLNWIALLLQFRAFTPELPITIAARHYLTTHYSVDLHGYDVVIGYRANDSCYSRYAESFISNGLSLRSLDRSLRLGELGEQTVVISQKGFDRLKFSYAYAVDKNVYYPKFLERDTNAKDTYYSGIAGGDTYCGDIFMSDIVREDIRSDDPRVQRILCV